MYATHAVKSFRKCAANAPIPQSTSLLPVHLQVTTRYRSHRLRKSERTWSYTGEWRWLEWQVVVGDSSTRCNSI